jgi:hypothetical protein
MAARGRLAKIDIGVPERVGRLLPVLARFRYQIVFS